MNRVKIAQKARTVPQKMYLGWIRTYLRNHFPEIRFRLNIKRYTGGKSLRVSWEGGPEENDLSDLKRLYDGAKIDPLHHQRIKLESIITRPNGNITTVKFGFDFIILRRREI